MVKKVNNYAIIIKSKWAKPKEMPKMKVIYNNVQLLKYKKKEIAFLKKKKRNKGGILWKDQKI